MEWGSFRQMLTIDRPWRGEKEVGEHTRLDLRRSQNVAQWINERWTIGLLFRHLRHCESCAPV
jgi:hypothetical protein